MNSSFSILWIALLTAPSAAAQTMVNGGPLAIEHPQGQQVAPLVVTLRDALERARNNDAQFQLVAADAQLAREDRVQAKSSLLPSVTQTTQYHGTQSNGVTTTGRFVKQDEVHVYRVWAVLHQELSPNTILQTGYRHAQAAEALANAKVEIAQRGLVVSVTKKYYALVTSQRKYATAQQAAQQARRFLELAQQAERLGQVAHSDVIKAELQDESQNQNYQEAQLAMEDDRLRLAVLLFPTLNENFTVIDDLDSAQALPPFAEIQGMAERQNPDLRAANAALLEANLSVRSARHAFLPSLAIDANYGIEANAFALRSVIANAPQYGPLPNLGYYVIANLTVPVWDGGTLRSKVRQAEVRERQVKVELTQAQREMLANVYSYYNEALVARTAVDSRRRAAALAEESLRLINLRYQAGESTALEVVDAQTTLVQARNAYADAQARYRTALATLQTVTGTF